MIFYRNNFRPLSQSQCAPSPCDEFVAPGVVCLFFRRCPSAVSRLIISIFVWVSIYTHPFWSRTHVIPEVTKIIPALADSYTSPSPSVEIFVPHIEAPIPHAHPNIESSSFFRICTIVGGTVNNISGYARLFIKTPTGTRVTTSEVSSPMSGFVPAFAFASPNVEAPRVHSFHIPNNSQSSKFKTNKILESWASGDKSIFSLHTSNVRCWLGLDLGCNRDLPDFSTLELEEVQV